MLDHLLQENDPRPFQAFVAKRFDLFLSYSAVDRQWAIRLKDGLEARGLTVWLDQDQIRPGDLFVSALEQGLLESRAVALLTSPESLRSGWLQEEYNRAVGLTRGGEQPVQLIPVILRDAELPGFLKSRSCINFRDEALFEQSLDLLVWGATGKKPKGTSARILKQRALPYPRQPTTTDNSVFDALFVRLLKAKGDFAANLRNVGYDMAHPQRQYSSIVLLAALNVAHRHVYPELSREEAHRLLGMRFTRKYFETVPGKVMRHLIMLVGLERCLTELPRIVSHVRTDTDARVEKLRPGRFRLVVCGDAIAADFMAGAFEGATLHGGKDLSAAVTLRVEVVRREPCEHEWAITLTRLKDGPAPWTHPAGDRGR